MSFLNELVQERARQLAEAEGAARGGAPLEDWNQEDGERLLRGVAMLAASPLDSERYSAVDFAATLAGLSEALPRVAVSWGEHWIAAYLLRCLSGDATRRQLLPVLQRKWGTYRVGSWARGFRTGDLEPCAARAQVPFTETFSAAFGNAPGARAALLTFQRDGALSVYLVEKVDGMHAGAGAVFVVDERVSSGGDCALHRRVQNWERLAASAVCCGIMSRLHEHCVTRSRVENGGGPRAQLLGTEAGRYQSTRMKLADMEIYLELSRRMVDRAARAMDVAPSSSAPLLSVASACAFVSKHAPKVAQSALELSLPNAEAGDGSWLRGLSATAFEVSADAGNGGGLLSAIGQAVLGLPEPSRGGGEGVS